MAVEKSTNPEKFKQMVDSDSQREKLKERIKFIKELSINSVIVPFPPRYIVQKYRSINPTLSPRDNRDVRHILSLIKAVAMLNAYNRLDEHRNVIANERDVEEGFKLWEGIARTQEYGIAPAALQFYEAFIVPAYIESHQKYGISVEELCEYCRKNRKKIASYTITKDLLPALISSNLVCYDHVEEISKKRKYIRPLNLPELNESKDDLPLSEPQKAETEAIHHPQNHQEIGKEEIWTGGSYRDYEDDNQNSYLADLI